jgi:hypothetical protein
MSRYLFASVALPAGVTFKRMVKDFDVIAVSKIHFNVIFSKTGETGDTCCRPLPDGEELRISRNETGRSVHPRAGGISSAVSILTALAK